MSNRKAISKKTRFEIFKRDAFKCQYCGKTSPDVILEVDHIKPVSEGGTNDITNLITACFDCNRGKSNILLDDNSVLEKQRKQLEELNEKRNQLEMMMKWREELVNIENEEVKIFIEKWEGETLHSIDYTGVVKVKKLIRKYGLALVLECLEISAEQYLVEDELFDFTEESVKKTFDLIGPIAANKIKHAEKPYMNDFFYLRGIMRNRYLYINERTSIDYLEKAYNYGATIENLRNFIFRCKNWTTFKNSMEYHLKVKESENE